MGREKWTSMFSFVYLSCPNYAFAKTAIRLVNAVVESIFINSRTAIAGAIISLLLVFLFRRQDFCYDLMTTQLLQICFLFIRSCNFN